MVVMFASNEGIVAQLGIRISDGDNLANSTGSRIVGSWVVENSPVVMSTYARPAISPFTIVAQR